MCFHTAKTLNRHGPLSASALNGSPRKAKLQSVRSLLFGGHEAREFVRVLGRFDGQTKTMRAFVRCLPSSMPLELSQSGKLLSPAYRWAFRPFALSDNFTALIASCFAKSENDVAR
jgi:hypothetical protein